MPDSAYVIADQERMSRAKNYFAWQARLALPELGRRVLEIGCGIGNFTERLLGRELVVAIDNEPACIDRLLARFPGQRNLHATAREAEASLTDLAQLGLDSCICLNVLEHIEDDVAALRNMAAPLLPGSRIVLIVPAFSALLGPIDHHLGHFRRYTSASLRATAGRAGLNVRKLRYMNLPGFFAWWINAHILRRQEQSAAQIGVFDSVVVPLISLIEGIVPPPFGQSLFAVLEKPAPQPPKAGTPKIEE